MAVTAAATARRRPSVVASRARRTWIIERIAHLVAWHDKLTAWATDRSHDAKPCSMNSAQSMGTAAPVSPSMT